MQRAQLIELLDAARAIGPGSDRSEIEAALTAGARLVAWWESQQLVAAQALHALGAPAEVVVAHASRCNGRDAERVVQRAITADAAPVFASALASGEVAGGHLDQLAISLRRLEPDQRAALLADAPRLIAAASASTPEEFGRSLRAHERRLVADDGMARLERQRSAVRLRSRVEIDSGMHIFTLAVDPVTGVRLHNIIGAATETLFHTASPAGCPTDPIEKQAFLRAHGLMSVIDGKGVRMGRPEIVVVVDTTATDGAGAPAIDWGLPVEIPRQVLIDLFPTADVHPVVVRNGVVLHAPGELNLGRSTRLANGAQRRALRAIYPTCALPGCTVPFDRCDIHHVDWWERGGRTDLARIIPVCSKHHHCIHDDGWCIHLAADRTLTVTHPDGSTMTTGPPKRCAA